MRCGTLVLGLACITISVVAAAPAGAVIVGQRDDFQDGSTQQWYGGDNSVNSPNGRIGPSDLYLALNTTGTSGAGSHLGAHNSEPRWNGDYLAAGITAMQADMINLGTTTLQMRVVMWGLGNRWTSITPVTLAPGSGWQRVTFPINQASLNRVFGSNSYTECLTQINQVMFRHATSSTTAGGSAINGRVGWDNITAVPSPAAATVLGLGAAAAFRRRRSS